MKYVQKRRLLLAFSLFAAVAVAALGGCELLNRESGQQEARRFAEEPNIKVYMHETGETKEMPLEEYLLGVVAGEMGNKDWPEATYAAQAILARSFTVDFMNRGGMPEQGADITTDEKEAQAYDPDKISDRIRSAVEATRGKVLTHNGKAIRTWFHSYSGGRTADAKEGLNYEDENPPYIASIELPDNEYVPDDVKNWSAEFTLDEVSRALAEHGYDLGSIEDLEVTGKGETGRATEITVTGANGEEKIHGADFRVMLGSEEMKSTLIDEFSVQGGKLVISGTGYGHGVGLSQWDAYMFAKEGMKAEEIAKKFFKDVEIKKLWD